MASEKNDGKKAGNPFAFGAKRPVKRQSAQRKMNRSAGKRY